MATPLAIWLSCSAALVSATALCVGCHGPNAVNLLKEAQVKFERVPSKVVQLPEPSIWSENDDLIVSGVVRRWPQVSGILAGHIDVSVLSADGQELMFITAQMVPEWIPTAGARLSSYTARSPIRPRLARS